MRWGHGSDDRHFHHPSYDTTPRGSAGYDATPRRASNDVDWPVAGRRGVERYVGDEFGAWDHLGTSREARRPESQRWIRSEESVAKRELPLLRQSWPCGERAGAPQWAGGRASGSDRYCGDGEPTRAERAEDWQCGPAAVALELRGLVRQHQTAVLSEQARPWSRSFPTEDLELSQKRHCSLDRSRKRGREVDWDGYRCHNRSWERDLERDRVEYGRRSSPPTLSQPSREHPTQESGNILRAQRGGGGQGREMWGETVKALARTHTHAQCEGRA